MRGECTVGEDRGVRKQVDSLRERKKRGDHFTFSRAEEEGTSHGKTDLGYRGPRRSGAKV